MTVITIDREFAERLVCDFNFLARHGGLDPTMRSAVLENRDKLLTALHPNPAISAKEIEKTRACAEEMTGKNGIPDAPDLLVNAETATVLSDGRNIRGVATSKKLTTTHVGQQWVPLKGSPDHEFFDDHYVIQTLASYRKPASLLVFVNVLRPSDGSPDIYEPVKRGSVPAYVIGEEVKP